jgi:hypothetical protein
MLTGRNYRTLTNGLEDIIENMSATDEGSVRLSNIDDVIFLHREVAMISGIGVALMLIALHVFTKMSPGTMRKVVYLSLYLAGLCTLIVSVALYRDQGQREMTGETVDVVLQQVTRISKQPEINEPAAVAASMGALLAALHVAMEFGRDDTLRNSPFVWLAALGCWAGIGIAASSEDKSFQTISNDRLYMNLPGAALVAFGTRELVVSSGHDWLSLPALGGGFAALLFGNAMVSPAPKPAL